MKKGNKYLLFFLLLHTIGTSAQTLHRPLSAGYTGLGAYSINHVDVFSFTRNQASLAQLKNNAAGVFGEKRFLLNELNSYTASAAILTASGNFAVKAGYHGFSDYNETQLGLAYGKKLGNKIDIGTQFNYQGIQIVSYGNAAALSFELGAILHITDKLHAGVHINNPVGGKFGKDQQEKMSSIYTTGLGYEASEKFFFTIDIQKEEDQPVNVNAGLQYKAVPQLLARAGISSATSSAWIGVGLLLPSFRIDVTTSYHQQLGFTPGLLFIFNFKSNAAQE